MQNKQKRLIIGVVVLLAIGAGYYFFLTPKSQPVVKPPEIKDEVVPTIAPSDIGLTLIARDDKKAVKFAVAKASDIDSIDYEITYLAKGDIPRGAIGTVKVSGKGSVESNYIDLGTCSSGKCKYDEDIHNLKLLLKITKTDGKISSAQTSLDL